jgi:hypothetical protein
VLPVVTAVAKTLLANDGEEIELSSPELVPEGDVTSRMAIPFGMPLYDFRCHWADYDPTWSSIYERMFVADPVPDAKTASLMVTFGVTVHFDGIICELQQSLRDNRGPR